MRRSLALLGLAVPLAIAAAVFFVPTAEPQAASGSTFVVPAHDGYGVADCLASGGDCGKTVADAWCAANGYHHAASFGPLGRDEVTASLSTSAARMTPSYSITCAE
ncbi:hypothetical protein QNA08_16685 [Chelatococcus sp. SYSU_G07232]|uniref:DUF3551 domain-containing protein n=1 Tax=Chelatococcus albus TaxID=3047466 RepID=A0ABT7AKF6_9HYPH|nr:hypothetical protein [Chelatococcus sp. SYSU_G07232]MDJ1159858.1 hypothetical protein [Chelatococcus sp. SYSU_G07232]